MASRCKDGTVTADFLNELPNFHIDTFSELHNICDRHFAIGDHFNCTILPFQK